MANTITAQILTSTQHDATIGDDGTQRGAYTEIVALLPSGEVTQFSLNDKYIPVLEKYWSEFQPGDTVRSIAERLVAQGSVTLYPDNNYGLTEGGGGYISTKTSFAHDMGVDVLINKVEYDKERIALHLADGTIIARSLTIKIGDKYRVSIDKRDRLFVNEFNIPKSLTNTFDPFTMVGGKISYVQQPAKQGFSAWGAFKNYKAPLATTVSGTTAPMPTDSDAPSNTNNDFFSGF